MGKKGHNKGGKAKPAYMRDPTEEIAELERLRLEEEEIARCYEEEKKEYDVFFACQVEQVLFREVQSPLVARLVARHHRCRRSRRSRRRCHFARR